MNILILADSLPYPLAHGQNLRIFYYVRTLQDRAAFDLLCLDERPVPSMLNGLFRRTEVIEPQGAGGVPPAGGRFSLQAMVPELPGFTGALERVLGEGTYDVIWVAGVKVVPSLPFGRLPVLIDLVDDEVLTYWREARRATNWADRLRHLYRAFMHYRFERRYYCCGDACLVVAEPDAKAFGRVCPRVPVEVLPNGVDTGYFAPRMEQEEPATLVFEGNMSFPPNADAVCYFAREIFPRIRREIPGARFQIVGKDPLPAVWELGEEEGIEVTGFVEDIRPYLAAATLFVSPLRKGAGIKNKVLQAWAMGKAVVATPESLGGLNTRDGGNICVRRTPDRFAEAILALIQDADQRVALGRAARETVLAEYGWEQKADAFYGLLDRVIDGGG